MMAREEAMRRLQADEEELNKQRLHAESLANEETRKEARARERFLSHLEEGFNKMMSISGIQTVQDLEVTPPGGDNNRPLLSLHLTTTTT